MDFDFDKWAQLARQDPDAFEALRKEAIEEGLKALPPDTQRRLKGLQFRIDMERRRSKTPLDSCIRLSNMMKEQFYTRFHPAIGNSGDSHYPSDRSTQARKKGAIMPFKKPAKE